MEHPKRLFLFAGYSKNESVDDSLIFYVSELSKYGDVIVCMDNDLKVRNLGPLKKYTIHTIAKRHGEYDFGSYKRAYEYADKHKLLSKYDYVYLVNDSVFGPLFDISNTLNKIESLDTDAGGLVVAKHKTHSYMESWFVRLNKKIAKSAWFKKFIMSVTRQPSKARITITYEHGLSNLIHEHKCSWAGVYNFYGRFTYNNPKYLFKHGCPFVKKACFTRHNGATGNQIKYILNHCQMRVQLPIMTTANKLYGNEYMNCFLTYNPIKIVLRKIKYALQKIINGGI